MINLAFGDDVYNSFTVNMIDSIGDGFILVVQHIYHLSEIFDEAAEQHTKWDDFARYDLWGQWQPLYTLKDTALR